MSRTIRVVRTVTYEIDEAGVDRLVEQMRNSLPVGTRQYGALKITVAHETGLQWPSDGERALSADRTGRNEAAENKVPEDTVAAESASTSTPGESSVVEELPPLLKSAKQRLRK